MQMDQVRQEASHLGFLSREQVLAAMERNQVLYNLIGEVERTLQNKRVQLGNSDIVSDSGRAAALKTQGEIAGMELVLSILERTTELDGTEHTKPAERSVDGGALSGRQSTLWHGISSSG